MLYGGRSATTAHDYCGCVVRFFIPAAMTSYSCARDMCATHNIIHMRKHHQHMLGCRRSEPASTQLSQSGMHADVKYNLHKGKD